MAGELSADVCLRFPGVCRTIILIVDRLPDNSKKRLGANRVDVKKCQGALRGASPVAQFPLEHRLFQARKA